MGANCCSSQENDFSVKKEIEKDEIVVFSKNGCPNSLSAKMLLISIGMNPRIIEINKSNYYFKEDLKGLTKSHEFPYIFVQGKYIGGYTHLEERVNNAETKRSLKNNK